MSHNGMLYGNFPEVVFMTQSSLRIVDLSFCGIEVFKYPVYCHQGITTEIESIDMSMNNMQCINAFAFSKCSWNKSLKMIYLKGNRLGDVKGNECNKDSNNIIGFVEPLQNLQVLNLAENQLDTFQHLQEIQLLKNLQHLDLSRNRFEDFALNLEQLTNLTFLDLSYNGIQCLSNDTTFQLEMLRRNNRAPVSVNLKGNALSCTCHCLHFFEWMMRTKIEFEERNAYQCAFDDGSKIHLTSLSIVLHRLQEKCLGSSWLKVLIFGEAFILMAITLSSTGYRYRYGIKYIALKIRYFRTRETLSRNFTYSAFISFDHLDAKFIIKELLPRLEVPETKLKFCIAQRNFIVGKAIMDNIVRALTKSYKTIFIVSKHFLKSKWCQEELFMAHQVSGLWERTEFSSFLEIQELAVIVLLLNWLLFARRFHSNAERTSSFVFSCQM